MPTTFRRSNALRAAPPGLGLGPDDHPPRILLLYGSLRERSYSRLADEEAARLLQFFGAEVRIFDPSDLPFPDQVAGDDHPAIHELREHAIWSEGMVWCSPERHGQITGLMKPQIDHLPLSLGAVRPTQGRTLAVMQVSGGSQSFNAVTACACSVAGCGCSPSRTSRASPKAFKEFGPDGRMKSSSLLRPHRRRDGGAGALHAPRPAARRRLVDRYSERKAAGTRADAAVDLASIALARQKRWREARPRRGRDRRRPAGLAVAYYLRRAGLDFRVVDAGVGPGGAWVNRLGLAAAVLTGRLQLASRLADAPRPRARAIRPATR